MKRLVLVPLLVSLPLAAPAHEPEDALRVKVELRGAAATGTALTKLAPPGVEGSDGCAQLSIAVHNRDRSGYSYYFPRLWVHAAIGAPAKGYRFAVAGDAQCAAAAGPATLIERDDGGQVVRLAKEIADLAPGTSKTVAIAIKVTGDDLIQNPGFEVFVEGEYRRVLSAPRTYHPLD